MKALSMTSAIDMALKPINQAIEREQQAAHHIAQYFKRPSAHYEADGRYYVDLEPGSIGDGEGFQDLPYQVRLYFGIDDDPFFFGFVVDAGTVEVNAALSRKYNEAYRTDKALKNKVDHFMSDAWEQLKEDEKHEGQLRESGVL